MSQKSKKEQDLLKEEESHIEKSPGSDLQEEESHLQNTLSIIRNNVENYNQQVSEMRAEIDNMLEHFHDDNPELIIALENSITLHDHMRRALERNEKALNKPYFGRIVFYDETLGRNESLYIGRGGISRDATHHVVIDWRAPVANTYYENGLGKCSYTAPGGKEIPIDLKLKRTYEIEKGRLLDYFDSEVISNDELLTKYLAKNKQAVLGEIVATIQKEQNEIIRKSPYHNIIVQGVAGSGKTTVAMHRISFILYNYQDRFKPEDFYIVGSNRILLNYITGVLPDLDVYGIRQMTMEQLFIRLLYEDWDEKKYGIQKKKRSDNKDSIKGTLEWFKELKTYCDRLEWNHIQRESVYLNPRQFVEGLRDGKSGVFDESRGKAEGPLTLLVDGAAVERYIRQNPGVSLQNKINMLNDRLIGKIKEEFLGKGVKYTEREKKAILKAYRNRYGTKVWKGLSVYELYHDFLLLQAEHGKSVEIPQTEFDVYDLAALAYLYKRVKETEVISEAHHIIIDEAQDFGMMAYSVLNFCIHGCTYTVMGDVSQNIHFGFGLNDWEELRQLLLTDESDSFGILKKSYRNTVEISEFATAILHHGSFSSYPVEPIIRHGDPVKVSECSDQKSLIKEAAHICRDWQEKGFDTIAVVCRNWEKADWAAEELRQHVEIMENDLEKAVFGTGIMVLPVEYTKGLEFDAVLILDPDRPDYPVDDGHAKLLYVAATRALHQLCILHTGNLTGLIADPLPESKTETKTETFDSAQNAASDHTAHRQSAGCGKDAVSNYRQAAPAKRQGSGSSPEPEAKKAKPLAKAGLGKRPEIVIRQPSEKYRHNFGQISKAGPTAVSGQPAEAGTSDASSLSNFPAFGDFPPTEKLRPSGHSRPDLAVRWVTKQPDGLYLQSRYGILRISPVGSAIVRISFCKNGQPDSAAPMGIAVQRTEKFWMYRDSGSLAEVTTDELMIQADKSTGALRYLTRDKKLLTAERSPECRLMEKDGDGKHRAWLFFNWKKEERLYAFQPEDAPGQTAPLKPNSAPAPGSAGISLRNSAKYISGSTNQNPPFLLSDQGYGIVLPAGYSAFCCDLSAYGSYLYTECGKQLDFYLIAGKRQETILNAYEYLRGRR